jgi:predicted TIM-barrel fold metal-dependent hydrolase
MSTTELHDIRLLQTGRRQFLRQSVGLATLSAFGPTIPVALGGPNESSAESETSPSSTLLVASAIDVHCHIFNARDIPIRNFVMMVAFEKYPLLNILDPLVILLSFVMDSFAPTAAQELAVIHHAAMRAEALSRPDNDAREVAAVAYALDQLQRGNAKFDPPISIRRLGNLRQSELDLLNRYSGPFAGERVSLTGPLLSAEALEKTARGLLNVSDIKNWIKWACLFTKYRYEIAEQLSSLSPTGSHEIKFYAPGMIDFAYWLGQFDTTSIADQVRVTAAISALPNHSYALHGLVAFDPWRQVEEPNTLSTIKDAVTKSGCIGVKLYPPMGFRPLFNIDERKFPAGLEDHYVDPGKRLDDALRTLYDWCISDDVPIVAHCSYSQFFRKKYGNRASPFFWEKALDQYPTLRLNLAHCGGIWDIDRDRHRPGAETWTKKVIELLGSGKYPNLYADVGDDTAVLENTREDAGLEKRITDRLAGYLHDNQRARGRLMFGTDWTLAGRELNMHRYYEYMKTRFCDGLNLSDSEREGVLGYNAASFLGLASVAGNKPKARLRLEAFYADHGLDPAVLQAFDRS